MAATTIDMIEPLSKRVAALGWHVQINMTADQLLMLTRCGTACRLRRNAWCGAGTGRIERAAQV